MVNRKKSLVVEKEKKTGNRISKEDGNGDDTPPKRPKKDSEQRQRNQPETGSAMGNDDPEEVKPGTSGTTKGIGPVAKVEPTVITTVDRQKDSAPTNPFPVICHQIATRSVTGRLSKRLRSYSPPKSPPPTKKQAKDAPKAGASHANTGSGTPETKTRKQWEQWSVQDKDLFFEALYEHGKDFEAIQNSISQKLKKRDPTSGVRTKDHIRHFYYRTWHKITKCIDTEGIDDVNKQALELYGLINYGEIRKRIGKLDEKIGQKLNELVHKGVTVIRMKQKNHRIKTPLCRALKKLHHIEDHKEEERSRMPDRVTVELFPCTNTAWAQIQTMAQNPRLRVTLRVSKRASSLIEFMNKKWMSDRVRMKDELKESEKSSTEIKISIPEGTKLSPLLLKHAPVVPKLELSFNNYVETMRGQQPSTASPPQNKKGPKSIFSKFEEIHLQQPSTSGTNQSDPVGGVQDNQVSSTEEISASTETFSLATLVTSPDKAQELVFKAPSSPVKNHCEMLCMEQCDDSAIPFIEAKPEMEDMVSVDDVDTIPAERESAKEPSQQEVEATEKQAKLEKGIVLSDCGNMTIAEMYMMMGCPKKMCLEYDWVEKKVKEDIWELNKKLTNMLRRLVHLATTEFIDFKKVKTTAVSQLNKSPSKCTCGAFRNNGTPPGNKMGTGRSPRGNSPASSRNKLSGRSPSTPSTSRRDPLRPSTPNREILSMPLVAPTTPTSSKRLPQILSPEMLLKSADEPVNMALGNVGGSDGVFKLPTAMPPRVQQVRPLYQGNSVTAAEKNHLLQQINMVQRHSEFYAPKRGGQRRFQRNVRRPLVVQRTLLPKAQAPTRQIMTLAMVPGVSTPGQTASFLPIMSSSVLKPCSTIIQSSSAIACSTASVNAVAVSQDFGAPHVVTTSKGTVTTMSLASMNKPTAIRRIIPTPVTTVSEDSSVFVQAIELGVANNNRLKEDVLEVQLPEPATPNPGVPARRSGDLHTPPHGQMDLASRPGDALLDSPAVFSQAFTLTNADPILSANSLSGSLHKTNTLGETMPSTSLGNETPNMSTLLDISMPSVDMGESTDKLLDLALMNSNSSFGGLVGDKDASLSSLLNPSDDPAALSPSKGFKGISALRTEEPWLGPGDLSMSCFLQDTPGKKTATEPAVSTASATWVKVPNRHAVEVAHPVVPPQAQPFVLGESSRDSIIFGNVETTFEVMMNENSMDYMSKFADLAAHINGSHQEALTLRKQTELLEEKAS